MLPGGAVSLVSGGVRGKWCRWWLTKREFLRQETTSGGREVAMCGWVVVAEDS